MTDLQRLLGSQNFQSESELQKFIDTFNGQQIPSFPNAALNFQEQAQDLVFAAYELPLAKARKNIEKALQLDSNCIEAYEFLGSIEKSVEIASTFYEKGIAIGRQIFGGKYWEEHKGEFWGFTKHDLLCVVCNNMRTVFIQWEKYKTVWLFWKR